MPLAVRALRLAATDADHVKTVRARLERADHGWGDAQRVPDADLDHLVIELGPARTGDDDVDLFLLVVPVAPRHARPRLVREAADAELGRLERGPREPPLDRHI